MKILNYLPRNMHFGPDQATSIDLCVYEQSLRSGHDILVVCNEIEKPFNNIPVRMLTGKSKVTKQQQLYSIIKDFQPDLIVVQQHGPTAHKLAKHFKTIPVLLHRHNFENTGRLSWLKRWRHKRRYETLGGIIFVSDTCKRDFIDQYSTLRTALHTVHNGIDRSLWQADKKKKNEIIFIGRIETHKNALSAAKAMAKVLEHRPDWSGCLIGPFAGPDNYISRVKQVVDNCPRLSLLDSQPHSTIKKRLQDAKISLICSERESFCLVAIESFAAGAAVISTANGALPETIGKAGLLLNNTDVDEIANSLRIMMEEYPDYCRLGYQQVTKFDLDETVQKLDEVYNKSIKVNALS